MSPESVLTTSVLMGLFALTGGGYGCLYSLGRLRARPALVRAGMGCWLLTLGLAIVIVVDTPLDLGWKLLILASALIYAIVPPMTWHYLQRLHAEKEHGS